MTAILRAATFGAICATASLLYAADGGCVPYSPGACCGSIWGVWNVYAREPLPFYALHPPVYYSLPVPRPYGYSPFAYPPGVMTPELLLGEPAVIQNHTIPGKPTAHEKPARMAVAPLRLTNPYVVQSDRRNDSQLAATAADREPSQPLVIFPAATAQR